MCNISVITRLLSAIFLTSSTVPGAEPWSLTRAVRCGLMWGDKSYEHRMQNFRPQHREAAKHDREYKERFSRSEVRYLGHFRSGSVVRKNFAFRENFDKTMNGSPPPRSRRNTARRRDGSCRSSTTPSSAIFVASQQGRVEAPLRYVNFF